MSKDLPEGLRAAADDPWGARAMRAHLQATLDTAFAPGQSVSALLVYVKPDDTVQCSGGVMSLHDQRAIAAATVEALVASAVQQGDDGMAQRARLALLALGVTGATVVVGGTTINPRYRP